MASFRVDAPEIPLSDIRWEEIGDEKNPRSRLLAHIRIGPLDMHLEAIEVYVGGDDLVHAIYEARDDDLGTLMNMEDTIFSTLEIEGRDYVLYATPYGE